MRSPGRAGREPFQRPVGSDRGEHSDPEVGIGTHVSCQQPRRPEMKRIDPKGWRGIELLHRDATLGTPRDVTLQETIPHHDVLSR